MIAGKTSQPPEDGRAGVVWGSLIGDALAMPVHWYYDRAALHRDYGVVRDYVAPRNPHPDSILWRSTYTPLNERGDILHEQAQYWGQRGVHYHQFLRAGENTLNLQLARVLMESLIARDGYDAEDYLQRYIDFMLTPGRHRDTYVEEYHRKFSPPTPAARTRASAAAATSTSVASPTSACSARFSAAIPASRAKPCASMCSLPIVTRKC